MEHPVKTNRLSKESSPYLLQHQHNPVDWYPWGSEAFDAARRENKPIFLSVGYSTCYWCHVMERQSFEVDAIAEEMNRHFINIKVDREERPDVDQLYMTAVQVLTRHGGWPMSVFLTPDLHPFYAGTYFPPTDQRGHPGFPRVVRSLSDAYHNRRSEVDNTAGQIVAALKHLAEPALPASPLLLDDSLLATMIERSVADYDSINGGFGSAPKFPRETLIELLLVHNRYFPNPARMMMVTHTLDALAFGGIRDQLGGAFHRYSTDARWLVPHFEIMLYDNAMLAWCYIEAFQQTHEQRYAEIARGIFDFVLREMTSPQGGFYTAFDAEVDAQEGLSYLWTRSELEATLAESLAEDAGAEEKIARFCRVYGLDEGPNFADPHHGNGHPDKNILFLAEPTDGAVLLDPELKSLREILYQHRLKRKQPLLDTKIITSWNALMIRALAFGGQILRESKYTEAAAKAAEFLLVHHRSDNGALRRTSRDGNAKYAGFLDDYAFLAQALLALHDSEPKGHWKEKASEIATAMTAKFADLEHGGFYFTEKDATDLIVRQKIASDSPLPSGNAVAALALLSLDQPDLARNTITAFAGQFAVNSESMSALLQALVLYLRAHPPFTVSTQTTSAVLDRPAPPKQTADDVVTVSTSWASETVLTVGVNVAAGFHINANAPAAEMIATQLTLIGDAPPAAVIEYPSPDHHQFDFTSEVVDVFSGGFTVVVRFVNPMPSGSTIRLALKYQACDNSACLPPVTKSFEAVRP